MKSSERVPLNPEICGCGRRARCRSRSVCSSFSSGRRIRGAGRLRPLSRPRAGAGGGTAVPDDSTCPGAMRISSPGSTGCSGDRPWIPLTRAGSAERARCRFSSTASRVARFDRRTAGRGRRPHRAVLVQHGLCVDAILRRHLHVALHAGDSRLRRGRRQPQRPQLRRRRCLARPRGAISSESDRDAVPACGVHAARAGDAPVAPCNGARRRGRRRC